MNYLEEFYDWMLKKGRKSKKKKIPSTPLSKASAKSNLNTVRKMLIDLGYVKQVRLKTKGSTYLKQTKSLDDTKKNRKFEYFTYSETHKNLKDIRDLSVKEIDRWVDNEFTNLQDPKELARKKVYIFRIWKFGEFLHFKKKDWTINKLTKLKDEVYYPDVKYHQQDTISPKRIDEFIDWLKEYSKDHPRIYKLYAMLFLSRWLGGMRLGEVVRIKENLVGAKGPNNGKLDYDLKSDYCIIYGKGDGGFNKPRESTVIPKVKEFLKELVKWRKQQNYKTDYMFENINHKPHSDSGIFINTWFRKLGIESGLFEDRDLPKIHFHALGRHTFGTYFSMFLPSDTIKAEMGIEDIKTLERYQNFSRELRNELMINSQNGNGNGYGKVDGINLFINRPERTEEPKQPKSKSDKLEVARALLGDVMKELTKEEKVKLITELL